LRILRGLSNIKKGDVVIHLGDVCIGDDADWHKKFLSGVSRAKSWLVLGNHDRKSKSWYLDVGWDWVGERMEFEIFGKHLVFTHEPVLEVSDGQLNIHGHLHSTKHHPEYDSLLNVSLGKYLCVALENTKYQPVTLNSVIK
jgi:calcineurin-like phosphoesterase family protein